MIYFSRHGCPDTLMIIICPIIIIHCRHHYCDGDAGPSPITTLSTMTRMIHIHMTMMVTMMTEVMAMTMTMAVMSTMTRRIHIRPGQLT